MCFQVVNLLKILISNRAVDALVDTGASISCISEYLCERIISNYHQKVARDNKFLGKPVFNAIRGVCGEIHPVRGTIELPFSINGLKVVHTFHIFSRLEHQMILGLDFLEAYKASINLSESTISFYEGAIETPMYTAKQPYSMSDKVKAAYSVILKPRSQTSLMIKAPKPYNGHQVLIEPLVSKHNTKFMTAKTVDVMYGQYTSCVVFNPTSVPIQLQRDTAIGTVTQLDKDFDIEPLTETHTAPHVGQVNTSDNVSPTNTDITQELNIDLEKSNLTNDQKQRLYHFLKQNRTVFATNMSELGSTNVYQHKIDTINETPVTSRHYRMSQEMKDLVEIEIAEMLKHKIIEPSTTEWNSPIVKKKEGGYRMAADLRKLNSKCKPINFPLPRAEDIFDSIGQPKAKLFSVLNLASGYWQISLDPETKQKAEIITHHRIWEWNKLPFGLVSAPAAFQKTLATVLRDLNWKQVLIYVDDVPVMSHSFEDHLVHLQQVFDRLKKANLTLKPSKSQFAAKELVYLGYVISKDGIRTDPSKTEVIRIYPIPNNQKQLRQAMGLFNFYRRFVKGFSQIAAPLNVLLKKDSEFKWSEQCQKAFTTLKNKLTEAPILAYPNLNLPFTLTTDALRYRFRIYS